MNITIAWMSQLTGKTEWTPYAVAQYSKEQGYYVSGQRTSWDLMSTGAQSLGLSVEYGNVNESYIRNNLTILHQ